LRKVFDFFWGPADPRTYALVRIALSVAGLANLVQLWPYRSEYFASTGMISLDGVRGTASGGLYPSVFYWVSSPGGVTVVFTAAAVALMALGLGWCTRAAAALVFAWHLSYSDRAFPILHSWDALLRIYSFLVLVSPIGRVWSLDHRRAPDAGRARAREPVPAYGLRLMQWQLFVVYMTTVWLKVPDEFWRNGQMCAYFSMSFYSRTPDNLFFAHNEWLSALQTYLSLAIETSVPWLLAFKRTRVAGLLAGFTLHFVIAITSILAVFSICMLPAYLAFVDGDDIDRFFAVLQRVRTGNIRGDTNRAGTAATPVGPSGGHDEPT
jgi:hypothetical protein